MTRFFITGSPYSMAAANSKTTKKRSAASQAGPKPKKIHLDKSEKSVVDNESKKVKRGRPVTLPRRDEHESSSDEGEESDSLDDEQDMQVDSPPVKDPNGPLFSFLLYISVNELRDIAIQLQGRPTKHNVFFLISVVQQNQMRPSL